MWYTRLLPLYSAVQFLNGYPRIYRNIVHCLRDRLPPEGTYLDVGAGPGYFSRELARVLTKARIEALDPSPECCRRIARDAEELGLAITPVCKTISELDPAAKYDVVVASSVFEHLGTGEDAASSVLTHLREGGLGVIVLMPDSALMRFICWLFGAEHVHAEELRRSVEALGHRWTYEPRASNRFRDVYLVT